MRRSWRTVLWASFLQDALSTASAFSFGNRRFKNEGLLDAGNLGLSAGRVAAWGDADGDQFTDAFVVDDTVSQVSVRLWDHTTFSFKPAGPNQSLTVPPANRIQNVVPSDFNQDGVLDVLVMSSPSKSNSANGELHLQLFFGQGGGTFNPSAIELPPSSRVQPLLLDATGDLGMDLLGHRSGADNSIKLWRNAMANPGNSSNEPFSIESIPLVDTSGKKTKSSCALSAPHSSAFIDLDGDCIADLFLVCEGRSVASPSYEVWTALKSDSPDKLAIPASYQLSQQGDLPSGAGMLSFADLDRDGTIDVIFASCDGTSCYINIANNEQMPVCSTQPADWTLPWLTGDKVQEGGTAFVNNTAAQDASSSKRANEACRNPSELCTADPAFRLAFGKGLKRFNVKDMLGPDWTLMLSDNSVTPARPVFLSVGDFNKDGYPDLLVVGSNERHEKSQAFLLQNTLCSRAPPNSPGCDNGSDSEARTFVRATGSDPLDAFTDIVGASFVDLDEDGSLDILLQTLQVSQRGGGRPQHGVKFIQNNLFFDSFFLKLLMLNGACDGTCERPAGAGGSFKPWGVNYAGASYKFTVLDPNGIRRAQHVGQLPQTSYGALLTPTSYLGLGRTNNYVELLEIGSSRRQAQHVLSMEGVIPNSQIFINPWQPQRETSEGRGNPSTWGKMMYLHPGDWITWVTVVLAGIIVVLLGVVILLHLHERREDEKERKRVVYAINFDAL
ncbi:hypothetical protein K437DRAFT_269305 [Tilletiaria anomala UBC 951]|uniref:T-cell immunomodulatory protein TIP C2 domain-containing protein n=1 Tax=Tilletiaria anomala (strain ATCC 24038 / CBS 436.72 / UBC 951) TaxID=1037660 RepID=A0A066VV89_TILAU|nr:uncharacterized protein K437DRAFT_269305 [Tilletiaria anomala UBC 951]KDN42724.1 hypothetical protein K437DRAFT_269305 [Tilletiaria anomala UBC 951]